MNGSAITTVEELRSYYINVFMPDLVKKDVISFDTETNQLSPLGIRCLGISLSTSSLNPCYIDLEKSTQRGNLLNAVAKLLNSIDVVVMHNAPFDIAVMMQEGYKITTQTYDTVVAIHLLNEAIEWKDLGLKSCAITWLHVNPDEVISFKRMQNVSIHSEQFYLYGRNDAKWTYQLFELTDSRLSGKLRNLMYKIEMPFQNVLAQIAINGMLVDSKYLDLLDEQTTEFSLKIETEMLTSLGLSVKRENDLWGHEVVSSPINFSSVAELALAIKRQLNIDLPIKKETGNYILDDYVLTTLVPQNTFFAQLKRWRELKTLRTTFINGIKKQLKANSDGRIRCNLLDFTTATGRLSCRNPNLENLPKPGEYYKINFRDVFIAPKGKKLISADFKGEELRITAAISGDKNLFDVCEKDKDIHLTVVNSWYNLGIPDEALYENHTDYQKYKKKYKAIRDKLKIAFPILYGSTAIGLAHNSGITEEEAQKGIDTFLAAYPGVKVAIDKCVETVFKQGYVETLAGRRRRFKKTWNEFKGRDTYHSADFRQAFNFLIQGVCSDILRIACNKLSLLFESKPEWEIKFLMLVHDEVLVECNEKFAEIAAKEMKEVMDNAVHLAMPLPVDVSICDKYGSK